MEIFDDPPQDPFLPYTDWLREGFKLGEMIGNVCFLATADQAGRPSSRAVLVRSYSRHGLHFYSNRLSRKGRELELRKDACALFYWPGLKRQFRLEGQVSLLSEAESDLYFAERPRQSQIAAWASEQSRPQSHHEFNLRFKLYESKFAFSEVPRPSHWGGYILEPKTMEFWREGPNRAHRRLRYDLGPDLDWAISELGP